MNLKENHKLNFILQKGLQKLLYCNIMILRNDG